MPDFYSSESREHVGPGNGDSPWESAPQNFLKSFSTVQGCAPHLLQEKEGVAGSHADHWLGGWRKEGALSFVRVP